MSHHVLVLVVLVSVLVSPSFSAFVLPIHKDPVVLQYYTSVKLTMRAKSTNLVIDLGFQFTWLKCNSRTTKSKTFHTIPCNTTLCRSLTGECPVNDRLIGLPGKPCRFFPYNPITHNIGDGHVGVDSLTLSTTIDGIKKGRSGQIHDYIFACATTIDLLQGLSKKVTGLVTFSRSSISLPSQISKSTSSPNVFALCLPSSSSIAPGAAFFGRPRGGSYIYEDLSKSLVYTPLIINPIKLDYLRYGSPGDEYYIGVTSINVNGKALKLKNPQPFLINNTNGLGGTKIRTGIPYTRMEPTFYAALTESFVKESAAMNLTVTKTPAPGPFRVCYEARDVPTHMGRPAVPSIELVMHRKEVVWKISGDNSMVRIRGKGVDLWCLGFVEETNMNAGIEIGGHQMENNLLEFDLHSNRFGFTLVSKSPQTTCSSFRFS